MRKQNTIAINADLGEGMENDVQLIPYLSYANIACGGHAGSETVIEQTILLANQHKVRVGAHPSYPDIENFGRKSMAISQSALELSLLNQIKLFEEIAIQLKVSMHHIKLHGALYNDVFRSAKKTQWFLNWSATHFKNSTLFIPCGAKQFMPKNYPNIIYEAFADRNYNADLSLVSRNEINAILQTPEVVVKHVQQMLLEHTVTSVEGKKVAMKPDTFCLHGDHPNVLPIAKSIYNLSVE
ncbi:LamB/YcsF family protein [Aquimarina agarilytica]|uniref:LamB/YcsF family protein n=1 Tax=Aquimarina agarilytica TaxID=1087449 RepID=UPI000287B639|nr:LamB/YcsF family protein [Aquimarina agarilytica]